MKDSKWKVYRTRFLVRAKQLTEPLFFVDALGREHHGKEGDYLVEWSDGCRRIDPQEIFEDVYVPMNDSGGKFPFMCKREWPVMEHRRSPSRRALVS